MPQRLLIVDDDKEIVRLVRAYLEKANYEVLVAYNGETALHVLRREQPELLILDLMLPDRDGWDITRFIRNDSQLKHIPIIMLTARVEDTDKIVGLEIGADDYITKPFNPREVVARVRALLRRSQVTTQMPAQILTVGSLRMEVGRREVTLDKSVIDLTPTEFDILKVLMENPGYAFTRGELIAKGMGYEYAGMDRTLDSHIKNMRRKMGADTIQTVYGVGYKLADR